MALAARTAAAVACLLLSLAASASGAGSPAPAPAPAPAVDCIAQAMAVSDCLDYVSPGSTSSKPSKECCGEVKVAVDNPVLVGCLCSFIGSKNLPIDMNRVFALPAACGASNTAFSKCHTATGSPIEAPAPSTGGPSTASPPVPAAASSLFTATALLATMAAPLLAYCYLF